MVGVVARLEPVKGVADLIEALALAAPDVPRLRLLVVGDGRSREALEQQTAELGLGDRVRFTGFRDDVGTLLSGLDVFCLPSHSEGLPFALLEACAHRLPLLVTGVGGHGRAAGRRRHRARGAPGRPGRPRPRPARPGRRAGARARRWPSGPTTWWPSASAWTPMIAATLGVYR